MVYSENTIGEMATTKTDKTVEAEAVGTQRTTTDMCHDWRQACFEELGFSAHEADVLAETLVSTTIMTQKGTKRTYESYLHHGNVRRLMAAGATPAQILELYI